jgi:hypothetical protein
MFDNIIKFDPFKDLRFYKRTFIHDGKVVKVDSFLEAKYNCYGEDMWKRIPTEDVVTEVTKEDFKYYNIKEEVLNETV